MGVKDGDKTLVLTLRKGAAFHDGRAVDAEIVRWNFQCWIGQPSHSWFLAGRRIKKVVAEARDRVRIEMDRPYALVPDLCAINPTGILVWQLVDGERSVRGIVDGIERHFRDTPPSVTDDVTALLDILVEEGMIGFEWTPDAENLANP